MEKPERSVEFQHIRRSDDDGIKIINESVERAMSFGQIHPYKGDVDKSTLSHAVTVVTICRIEETQSDGDVLIAYGYAFCTMAFRRQKGRLASFGRAEWMLRGLRAHHASRVASDKMDKILDDLKATPESAVAVKSDHGLAVD